MAHGGERRAVLAALAANFGIAVVKFLGFAITGAASLLAEAIHSFADTGNQGLLLFGDARAARNPTAGHPFGFARERYFWAFVVALVLFSGGGVFAVYEGVHKLSHPGEPTALWLAVSILVAAFVLESFSLRTAVREARPLKGDASWAAYLRHSKSAELPVVLLEDLGALVGLVFALCGIVAAEVTGDQRYDAIGSLAIGGLLMVIAGVLAVQMRSLLIGEAAAPEVDARVIRIVEDDARVVRLTDLRTQHFGPHEILVGVELELDHTLTGIELTEALREIEDRIRVEIPDILEVYLEPHTGDLT